MRGKKDGMWEKYLDKEKNFFFEKKKNGEGGGGKYLEKINILLSIF